MKPKGFSTMTTERRREVAAAGGAKANELGRAYKWNSEAAKDAARRSAEVRRAKARRDVKGLDGDESAR